jgi:hypothetical protein
VHHDLLADAGQVTELHAPRSGPGQAVVGEHNVDLVRHGPDQDLEEGLCSQLAGLTVKAGEDEFGGSVNGHKEVGLTLSGSELADVEVDPGSSPSAGSAGLAGLEALDLVPRGTSQA